MADAAVAVLAGRVVVVVVRLGLVGFRVLVVSGRPMVVRVPMVVLVLVVMRLLVGVGPGVCRLGRPDPPRRRPSPKSIQPPIATIEMAATSGAERTTRSGDRICSAPTISAARTRIPSVCENVTDSPRPAAWSGVPRVPTR